MGIVATNKDSKRIEHLRRIYLVVNEANNPTGEFRKQEVSPKRFNYIDKKIILKDVALIASVIILAFSGYLLSKYVG